MSEVEWSVTGPVATITLSRPERMNSITIQLSRELERALSDIGDRQDVNVAVIRGAGGNFCAGGDFHEVERLRTGGPKSLTPLFEHFSRALTLIGEIPQPVVAAVEGVAMAGGFELMLAADLALVREDARLCDTHINYGQIPGGGSTQRLPRLVGRQRALAHLLSGETLPAHDAVGWGIAHKCFPVETFEDDVAQFTSDLAARRRDALTTIKRLVNQGMHSTLEDGLYAERAAVIEHIAGDAGRSGFDAFANRP